MRIYPHSRWQKRLWWTALFVLAVAGLWACLVATRDPINRSTCLKLGPNMTREEVEALLGPPAWRMQNVEDAIENLHDTPILYLPPPITPRMGDLTSEGSMELAHGDLGAITEGYVWEGSEGRIHVFLDEQGRVMLAWFLQRVTWRFRLQQWLPWLDSIR